MTRVSAHLFLYLLYVRKLFDSLKLWILVKTAPKILVSSNGVVWGVLDTAHCDQPIELS